VHPSEPSRRASEPRAAGDAPQSGAKSEIFFGWWVVGGAFLIYFVSGGLFHTATVFFEALSTDFQWERGALSGAFSVGLIVAGVSAPLWGRIADRHGPRSSFLPGALITGVLCLLLSQVSNLASLYVFYIAFTFGSAGISLVPISVLLSNWFVEKRGRAIGIAYTGAGFGGLVFTPVAGLLVERLGWRSAYAIGGIAVIALIMPVVLWLKNRPEDLGLLPDGRDPSLPDSASADGDAAAGGTDASLTLGGAARTSAFWLVALIWMVTMMALSAVGLHQVAFLTDVGLSMESASLAAGAVGGMSILGRIGFGVLSERFPIRRLYAVCYLACGVAVALLWATPSFGSTSLVGYVACFGIATGGSFAMTALLVGDLFGIRALGEIFGLLGLIATIGGAIGVTGAGLIFDRAGSYDAVFAVCVALSWLGAVLILFVRPPSQAPGATLASEDR
jgi:sugar phosphate permease